MVASIHPEAAVGMKWTLLSTNLILLRAAVSQHFNSSWGKATGTGRYSLGTVLLIKMVTFLNSSDDGSKIKSFSASLVAVAISLHVK